MNKKIILFDGMCNFCNYWVNFIIDHDSDDSFVFSALQSKTGQHLLKKFNLPLGDFDSFIVIDGNKYFIKSDAAISIVKELKGWPKLLLIGKFLPGFFRNFIYDLIARNRYRIFGRRQTCRVPSERERAKFLE